MIQNSLDQNREEVENREIRYLPDLSIFNLLSCCFACVLVGRIVNHYPNHPTHRLYFGEVETPCFVTISLQNQNQNICSVVAPLDSGPNISLYIHRQFLLNMI